MFFKKQKELVVQTRTVIRTEEIDIGKGILRIKTHDGKTYDRPLMGNIRWNVYQRFDQIARSINRNCMAPVTDTKYIDGKSIKSMDLVDTEKHIITQRYFREEKEGYVLKENEEWDKFRA